MIVELSINNKQEFRWHENMQLREVREELESYDTKVVKIHTRKDIALDDWLKVTNRNTKAEIGSICDDFNDIS